MLDTQHGQPPVDEDDILITCALRIDGWCYQEDTGFDHRRTVDTFFDAGEWRGSTDELLTTFFGLQRLLFKWGGEMLPRTDKHWRAFRSLFLIVCEYSAPDAYAHPDYLTKWERRYASRIDECRVLVRRIHDRTHYDDTAPTP